MICSRGGRLVNGSHSPAPPRREWWAFFRAGAVPAVSAAHAGSCLAWRLVVKGAGVGPSFWRFTVSWFPFYRRRTMMSHTFLRVTSTLITVAGLVFTSADVFARSCCASKCGRSRCCRSSCGNSCGSSCNSCGNSCGSSCGQSSCCAASSCSSSCSAASACCTPAATCCSPSATCCAAGSSCCGAGSSCSAPAADGNTAPPAPTPAPAPSA